MDPSQEPIVRQLREKAFGNDRALIDGVSARLRVVVQLKSYKDSRRYE